MPKPSLKLTTPYKKFKQDVMVHALDEIPALSVKVYQDNASAYGDRTQMNQLVEDVISGKVSKIYILWEDRLSRSPCLTRLLESICGNRGVEIVVIESECLDKDELEIAFTECMHLINLVVNKKNGRRGGAKLKCNMDQDTLSLCYDMYRQGHSLRAIEDELKARNIKGEKGYFSRAVIGARIKENLKTLQAVNKYQPKDSCDAFLGKYVKRSRGKQITSRAAIARAYKAYCGETSQVPTSATHLSSLIDKLYPKVEKTRNVNRKVFYVGLSLTTNKTK